MVEGEQQGLVLVGTFFMVAEEYLPPTAAPGTWALMSPAQGRPGCRSWSPLSRRRNGKPKKSEDAQNGEPLQDMGWTWRTWPPCVKGNAARLAISAPLRRNWRTLAATAEPGATGSVGPQSPRWKPGRWRRIPARSGCGQPQIPSGTPRAIGQLMSTLRSRRRWPDRPQGRTRPQNPAWSMTRGVGEACQSQNGACGPAQGANAGWHGRHTHGGGVRGAGNRGMRRIWWKAR